MMKKFKNLLFALVALLIVSTCKKTGSGVNPLSSVKNLGVGAYITVDTILNQNLNFAALATSTVGIEVTQAPAGQAITSIILFAATSTSIDTTNWHRIKTVPYTGPKTKLTVTGQELSNALGTPIGNFSPGSNYTFFTRVVTKSGATFDASNTANDAGTGLNGGANYKAAFSFGAYIVCPFVGPVAGTYTVVRDDWDDWSAGQTVQVTDGGTNQVNLSQVYPGAPDGGVSTGHFIVNVDPATGTAYIPTEDIGYYGSPPDFTVTGSGGSVNATLGTQCGYIFSCTGYINVTVDFKTVTGAEYGTYTLILQKK